MQAVQHRVAGDPFADKCHIPDGVKEAIEWEAKHEPEVITRTREEIVTRIESAAAAYRSSGRCDRWMADAAPSVARVSESVCGPLLEELARLTKHSDGTCSDMFRKGAPLYGNCRFMMWGMK